eukprot:tig00000492_g1513.t1
MGVFSILTSPIRAVGSTLGLVGSSTVGGLGVGGLIGGLTGSRSSSSSSSSSSFLLGVVITLVIVALILGLLFYAVLRRVPSLPTFRAPGAPSAPTIRPVDGLNLGTVRAPGTDFSTPDIGYRPPSVVGRPGDLGSSLDIDSAISRPQTGAGTGGVGDIGTVRAGAGDINTRTGTAGSADLDARFGDTISTRPRESDMDAAAASRLDINKKVVLEMPTPSKQWSTTKRVTVGVVAGIGGLIGLNVVSNLIKDTSDKLTGVGKEDEKDKDTPPPTPPPNPPPGTPGNDPNKNKTINTGGQNAQLQNKATGDEPPLPPGLPNDAIYDPETNLYYDAKTGEPIVDKQGLPVMYIPPFLPQDPRVCMMDPESGAYFNPKTMEWYVDENGDPILNPWSAAVKSAKQRRLIFIRRPSLPRNTFHSSSRPFMGSGGLSASASENSLIARPTFATLSFHAGNTSSVKVFLNSPTRTVGSTMPAGSRRA